MSIFRNKKIFFFDGDGTIWYPKETKRTKAPYWVYGDTNSAEINTSGIEKLVVSDTTFETLKELNQKGVKLILLSTHPHEPEIAQQVLHMKLAHLGLLNIFYECLATDGRPEAKGEEILKFLKKYKLPKTQALMIGDSYSYDYLSAKKVGVDVVLLKSDYLKHPPRGPRVKKLIDEIRDVIGFC